MFRKKRQPAPYYRMPGAPFNPVTGQRAQMGLPVTSGTILATFQVIGDDPSDPNTADTHDNYIVCRGFEPEIDPFFRYLHDPYTKPDTTPIKVAKPYSVRGTFPYVRGQVIVAARIRTRLGDNQGKARATTGHPADLDEVVDPLLDDGNVAVSWLDISQPVAVPTIYCARNMSADVTIARLSSGYLKPWTYVGGGGIGNSEDADGNQIIESTGKYVLHIYAPLSATTFGSDDVVVDLHVYVDRVGVGETEIGSAGITITTHEFYSPGGTMAFSIAANLEAGDVVKLFVNALTGTVTFQGTYPFPSSATAARMQYTLIKLP